MQLSKNWSRTKRYKDGMNHNFAKNSRLSSCKIVGHLQTLKSIWITQNKLQQYSKIFNFFNKIGLNLKNCNFLKFRILFQFLCKISLFHKYFIWRFVIFKIIFIFYKDIKKITILIFRNIFLIKNLKNWPENFGIY